MCSPYRPSNSGFYWVRKRVPDDLRHIIGKREIKRSLKTTDPREAKRRALSVCAEIDQLLVNAKRSLTMGAAEMDALQGEYYRSRVSAITAEADKEGWLPEHYEMMADQLADITETNLPSQLDHAAYEEHRTAAASQWGIRAIQKTLRDQGVTPPARLLEKLGERAFRAELAAYHAAYAKTYGDPLWQPPVYGTAALTNSQTLPELFTQYAASVQLPPKTVDSWRGYIDRANKYFRGKPASVITKQDIRSFAEALQQGNKEASPKGRPLAAKTVNDNYIASLSAVYKWAIEREKLETDPTKRVRVTARAKETAGIEQYTREQVATILRATRQPQPARTKQETRNVRRWAPWLAAFTGARIGELLWLRREDVRTSDGVYFIAIQPDTKGGARGIKNRSSIRSTPLHPAIIEEGFLDYWRSLPEGTEYLFPGDWSDKDGDRAKAPANKLREWIKEQLPDADWQRLSPNHSFRHWLVSECRTAKIDGDRQRVITGHGQKDVHGRYGAADVRTLYNDIKTIQSPLPPLVTQAQSH
ncbi:site-specific integrase [Marinobacter salarius]|uniref:site-specific integrase n=1 Tax=Marinobacter salarius TaxID=1420917 RepID=UPI0022B20D33|nr:site-specific integrase [Marinobacter salarius]MCZ4286378.1 site-specific integrase [Marinobacter salarius]